MSGIVLVIGELAEDSRVENHRVEQVVGVGSGESMVHLLRTGVALPMTKPSAQALIKGILHAASTNQKIYFEPFISFNISA